MKKRFFGLGVAALALVLGLVQVQQASALDNQGFFASTSERDAWLLETLEKYPYYCYTPNANQQFASVASLLPQALNYRPIGETGFCFLTRIGTVMTISFRKTKAEIEETMALDDPGPFEAGSTAASRRETAKRILDCLAKYNTDKSATLN